MAPSSTQQGVNSNTLAAQRSRIIPSQTGSYPYNPVVFGPTVFQFARGKVFPSVGITNIFLLRNR